MSPHFTSSCAKKQCYLSEGGTFLIFFNVLTGVVLVWHYAADYRGRLNQVVQSVGGPRGRECATSCQTTQRNNQSSEWLQDRREKRKIEEMEEE